MSNSSPTNTTPGQNSTRVTYDECRYTSVTTARGCSIYRTCRDCLTKPGCQIGTDGFCESVHPSASSTSYDYRDAFNQSLVLPNANYLNGTDLLGEQSWQFPATEVKYCPANDTICADCIQQRFWLNIGAPEDSRFCVGANDCVCVSNCVRPDNATHCSIATSSPSYVTESSGDAITEVMEWLVGIGVALVLLVIGCCVWCCCDIHKDKRERKTHPPARRDNGYPITTEERELPTSTYVVVHPVHSPRFQS